MMKVMKWTAGFLFAGICFGVSSATELNLATVGPDTLLTIEYNEKHYYLTNVYSGDINGDHCDDMIIIYGYYTKYHEYIDPLIIKIIEGSPEFYGSGTLDLHNPSNISSKEYRYNFESLAFGDLNGDGFEDIILDDWLHDQFQILFGSPNLIDETKTIRIQNTTNDIFRNCLSVDDINGDGIDDLVIASMYDDFVLRSTKQTSVNPENYPGSVKILLGSPSLTSRDNKNVDLNKESWKIIVGEYDTYSFGELMATGDFDNDGNIDIIIGSREKESGKSRLNLLFNIQGFPDKIIDMTINENFLPSDFELKGTVIAGDFDGNGCDDLLYQVYLDTGELQTVIVNGGDHLKSIGNNSDTILTNYALRIRDTKTGGKDVYDINNDGFCDLIITIDSRKFIIFGSPDFYEMGDIDFDNAFSKGISLVYNELSVGQTAGGDFNGDDKTDAILTTRGSDYDFNEGVHYAAPFHILWGGKLLSNSVYVHPANGNWTPTQFALLPNTPNPFNAGTALRFYVPQQDAAVTIRVYSLTGALVAEIADDVFTRGYHTVQWNPDGCASGVYFCRLQSGESVLTRKMMFMK